jgi:glutamine amidotransferase
MNVTIVDYNSGNISSVINSFKEVAKEKIKIVVSSNLNKIKSSDKIVLPGQGSFKSCIDALNSIDGLVDTLNEITRINKKPCLGFVLAFKCLLMLGMRK